jgi:aryl-alcohol dehydrogenase-like predicted oxidoreductase
MSQLKGNIASIDLELSDELLEQIDAIQRRYPNPSP